MKICIININFETNILSVLCLKVLNQQHFDKVFNFLISNLGRIYLVLHLKKFKTVFYKMYLILLYWLKQMK